MLDAGLGHSHVQCGAELGDLGCAGTKLCLPSSGAAHRVSDKFLHSPLLSSSARQYLLSLSSWQYLPVFVVFCIFINMDSYRILLRADQPVFGKMVL